MSIEIDDTMVHVDMGAHGVRLCVHASNTDERLDQTIEDWFDSSGEVFIDFFFKPAEILDSAIAMHEMPARGHKIDADAKLMFEALRKELAEMVARIDALEFDKF